MDREAAKQTVIAEVDRRADDLIRVSREIHAHPELCYEERFAHDVLTAAIAAARHRGTEPDRALLRPGRARGRRALEGDQRARRRGARLHERRRVAPTHPADRTRPWCLPACRRQAQYRARLRRILLVRPLE